MREISYAYGWNHFDRDRDLAAVLRSVWPAYPEYVEDLRAFGAWAGREAYEAAYHIDHDARPVLVTHDLEEAAALGQRLCVLEGGRTLQSGTPREVMNRPATLAIARLLDAQNLFLGEVLRRRDDAPGLALGWRGRVLRAEGGGDFVPGERIAWTVPPGAIALSPDRAETENAVAGTIAEVAVLPGIVRVVFLADADPDSAFVFPLAPGATPPNPGAPATITFAPAMVHVMKRG